MICLRFICYPLQIWKHDWRTFLFKLFVWGSSGICHQKVISSIQKTGHFDSRGGGGSGYMTPKQIFQAETNMTLNFNLKRKESSFKTETTLFGIFGWRWVFKLSLWAIYLNCFSLFLFLGWWLLNYLHLLWITIVTFYHWFKFSAWCRGTQKTLRLPSGTSSMSTPYVQFKVPIPGLSMYLGVS